MALEPPRESRSTLWRAEDRLEAVLRAGRMATWEWDPATGATTASEMMEGLFGLPPGQRWQGRAQAFRLVHPEDRARHRALVEAAVRAGGGWHDEFRVIHPRDGEVAWLEERAESVREPRSGVVRVVGVVWDVTERKRAEQQLRHAREQLEAHVHDRTRDEDERRAMQRQLVNAQEAERRRISRELHDQLGQQVSALTFKLAMLKRDPRLAAELRDEIEKLEKMAGETDSQLDFLVWELRPTALDDLGLGPALADYASGWSKHFGVEVRIRTEGFTGRRLDPEIETVFYRIVQEALNNIAKHANARLVTIGLDRTSKAVSLVIQDDGVGFDVLHPHLPGNRGLGVVGMRERAALVGGEVAVHSEPGKGTSVAVLVPLAAGRANRRLP